MFIFNYLNHHSHFTDPKCGIELIFKTTLMKMQKNTMFRVYKYMNSSEWSIIKYCNTTLFQKFTHLGYDFELRIEKDGKKVMICHRGIYLDGGIIYSQFKAEYNNNPDGWYLGLNWDSYPEVLNDIDEKLNFIKQSA